ncbi:MAG: ribonuclease M5 [Bacilli bacterium]
MEKYYIDGVIVVEGKSDVTFLQEFIDTVFVTTNGSEISKETINYIKELKKHNRVIVLTDPDSPGQRLRSILDENIEGLEHAFVDKKNSIKKHKVGVAESTKEEVLKALKHSIISSKSTIQTITLDELYSLHLSGYDNSSYLRNKICEELNLGFCSTNKTFLKRLNALQIDKTKLEEILERITNDDCE